MTDISGWPGTLRSGATTTRPARSSAAPVPRANSAPSGDPATPAAQITVRESICSRRVAGRGLAVDAVAVDSGDARIGAYLDAEPLELCPGAGRLLGNERAEDAG